MVIDVGAGRSKATALHYAVQGGHLESARILIQYGANVNSLTITEDVRVFPFLFPFHFLYFAEFCPVDIMIN